MIPAPFFCAHEGCSKCNGCVGPAILARFKIGYNAVLFSCYAGLQRLTGGSMAEQSDLMRIPLPRGWPGRVKSATLHVISLAQFALAYPSITLTRSKKTKGPVASTMNTNIPMIRFGMSGRMNGK